MSYAEYRDMRRFPALDGLRAIGALMVLAFHFGGPMWSWSSGWIGVHLFFALSGFLITTLLLREEERRRRVSLPAFYIRRIFRILPVYFVVLAATYAVAHFSGSAEQVRKSMPHYLLMLNEFAPTKAFLQSWTIGIEQKFYLFWPLVAFVFVAGAFTRRLAITVVSIVCLIALIPSADPFPRWPIHYVVILAGCLLAIVMHHPRGYAIVRPLTHPVTATVIVAVVATVIAVGFAGAPVALPNWAGADNVEAHILLAGTVVGVALLLPALLSRSIPAKLLSLRPIVFVGERSYSMYMVQYIAAKVVLGLAPLLPRHSNKSFLAIAVVALLAADLLYRWVELPMIDVGRRLAARYTKPSRGAPPPTTAPPAAADGRDLLEPRPPAHAAPASPAR